MDITEDKFTGGGYRNRLFEAVLFSTIVIGLLGLRAYFESDHSASAPTPVESGFFEGPECNRACWQGLVIGQTTPNDLEAFVEENAASITWLRIPRESPEGFSRHSYRYFDKSSLSFSFQNDSLIGITLEGALDLDFATIVGELGAPEYTSTISYVSNEDNSLSAGGFGVYYHEQGYYFGFQLENIRREGDKVRVCINESDLVTHARVLPVAPIEEFALRVETWRAEWSPTEGHVIRYTRLVEWEGFGCLILPYDGN